MPKAMLKSSVSDQLKNHVKMPSISLFRLIGGHFFAFFGKIAKIAVTFTVEILLRG